MARCLYYCHGIFLLVVLFGTRCRVLVAAASSSFDDPSFAIISSSSSSNNNNIMVEPFAFARRRRSVSEARLWLDDEDDDDDNEDHLMDTTIYSTTTSAGLDGAKPSSSTSMETRATGRRRRRRSSSSSPMIRLPMSLLQEDPLDLESPQKTQLPTNNKPAAADTTTSWTEQSLLDFEHRIRHTFGSTVTPQLLKTGTTIAGVCGYDTARQQPFVVLGADTRATAGRMVADKRCQKIHCLASNMWCCGAGTSADLDQVTRHCRYSLALQALVEQDSIGNSGPRKQWSIQDEPDYASHLESTATHVASMATACRFLRNLLYESGGNIGANLIVGGVDEGTGIPHIRAIHPHGSMDPLPYAALGSGGLAAMAVIESRFHPNITLEEGIQIVKEAIFSGIQNDMGSGSQVDLCVITTTAPSSCGSKEERLRVVSNYTRAVVPEQDLPVQEKLVKVSSSSSKDTSTPGVNGFGNHPYLVRSEQVILPSRANEEQDRLSQWNQLFGLERENS